MSAFADFERKQILERQREGIASAKARGKRWGAEKQYVHDSEFEENLFRMYRDRMISFEEAGAAWGSCGSFQYQYRKWQKVGASA